MAKRKKKTVMKQEIQMVDLLNNKVSCWLLLVLYNLHGQANQIGPLPGIVSSNRKKTGVDFRKDFCLGKISQKKRLFIRCSLPENLFFFIFISLIAKLRFQSNWLNSKASHQFTKILRFSKA
ncbi:hypothetical protein F4703DRAFT_1798569 [Phycomyces blakesleeanus]